MVIRLCKLCLKPIKHEEAEFSADTYGEILHTICYREYVKEKKKRRAMEVSSSIRDWGGFIDDFGRWVQVSGKPSSCNLPAIEGLPWDKDEKPHSDGTVERGSIYGEASSWGDPKPLA